VALTTHPHSIAKVKERVELYLYSPLWAFVACSRVIFTFTFTAVSCAFGITHSLTHNNNNNNTNELREYLTHASLLTQHLQANTVSFTNRHMHNAHSM
jgi:hypothetical protein